MTSSSSSSSSSPSSFPVGSRVSLHGLSKAEYNGKVGTVRSAASPSTGRQEVHVDDMSKSVALRPANLRYVPRDVGGLTVREMKAVLRRRGTTTKEEGWTGMDKSQLAELVRSRVSGPEEVAAILAEAAAAAASSASSDGTSSSSSSSSPSSSLGGTGGADQLRAQADAMASMSPEQMRQQARMLRSMDPATVRRMNPQMAGFADAQIRAAADQMEMMANNPGMMRTAAERMRNMSPEEAERMRRQAAAGMGSGGGGGGAVPPAPPGYGTVNAATGAPFPTGGAAAAAPAPAVTKEQLQSQAEQLSNLSPDQLRQQASMLRSMDPAALRAMNPQMAGMTDAQVRAAADQMEMMAANPDMVRMAAEQMRGMSPEDVEALRRMQAQMGTGGGGDAPDGGPQDFASMDPAKMMENMDARQVKASLDMLKKNPEMLKQMMKTNPAAKNVSEEQLMKGIDAFSNMDEKQIERAMGWLARAQRVAGPVMRAWKTANGWFGGHLGKVLLFAAAYGVVRWASGYFSGVGDSPSPGEAGLADLEGLVHKQAAGIVDQDEFGEEF